MSWNGSFTDSLSKGTQVKVASYLPSSQPKCQSTAWQIGFDSNRPKQERPLPKGKTTTIALARPTKGFDVETDAQHRAVEFSERGHKLQRLTNRPHEMEERSPERSAQTSISSICHRDLYAGGIEAVLRRSGADGTSPQRTGTGRSSVVTSAAASTKQQNNNENQQEDEEEEVPPLEILADEGWAKPRIDAEKLRDPYLRKEGLHISDPGVYSHISKRLVSSRSLTRAICDKSVDFNFRFVTK